jgi:cephalosporin hydroxylase
MTDVRTWWKTSRVGIRRAVTRARRQGVIDDFHLLYYYGDTWKNTYWMGRRILKCPLDLWQYQEMIVSLKPDVILETGTADGGSALFLSQMCDLAAHGRVVTIDIDHPLDKLPRHDRITYVTGSSISEPVLERVRQEVKDADTVLVILDSDHSESHVRKELEAFQHFVTPDSYMVVEDTNVNGHPVGPRFGPGPMEAVDDFMTTTDRFVIDSNRERFLMTQNPKGYLRRTH